ncbi:MarR family winged helix-turn-helix transcriptional regulator [Sporosarcina siberiensis]|uniref:MarR family winged helix-turn-helix transcriptional regulator n=1 Tax=Sporosarcina siberiensis TaxID=1365606 RepID=A0ABW4SES6_9BACL
MNPFIHELLQKSRLISKEVNEVLKEHNLFSAQWSVLYCIHQHKEMTLTEIWKYLNVEAPTITRTVNRLIKLGWLTTVEGKDRREKIVRLSESALSTFPTIKTSVIEFEKSFLADITQEEQVLLRALLSKI